jgi:DNA-binding CsgD family transcriptional regulator
MATEESLATAVEAIYDAAVDSVQWPRALVAVAQAIGGRLPMMHYHDTRMHAGRFLLHAGYEMGTVKAYQDYYSARNVWLRSGAQLLRTRAVRSSHMMSTRRELLRSEWYSDFLRPLEVSQAVGATLIDRDDGVVSCITILAGHERRDFGEEDLRALEFLLPHLRRALRVHTRMMECTGRERTWLEALEVATFGVLLVTERWKVLYANPVARSMLAMECGLSTDADGLRAAGRNDTARLRALIGRCADTSARRALHAGGTLHMARPGGAMPIEVVVCPLAAGNAPPLPERAVAALYLRDLADAPARVGALAGIYGLTVAEARVFEVLVNGVSGKGAARALGISYNTLKTHLQHIFLKTGARKQVELIHLAHYAAGTLQAGSGPSAKPTLRHPKG